MCKEPQEKSEPPIVVWLVISWSVERLVGGVFTSIDLAAEWMAKSERSSKGYYLESHTLNQGREE